jgi:hypothetical protein
MAPLTSLAGAATRSRHPVRRTADGPAIFIGSIVAWPLLRCWPVTFRPGARRVLFPDRIALATAARLERRGSECPRFRSSRAHDFLRCVRRTASVFTRRTQSVRNVAFACGRRGGGPVNLLPLPTREQRSASHTLVCGMRPRGRLRFVVHRSPIASPRFVLPENKRSNSNWKIGGAARI